MAVEFEHFLQKILVRPLADAHIFTLRKKGEESRPGCNGAVTHSIAKSHATRNKAERQLVCVDAAKPRGGAAAQPPRAKITFFREPILQKFEQGQDRNFCPEPEAQARPHLPTKRTSGASRLSGSAPSSWARASRCPMIRVSARLNSRGISRCRMSASNM